MAVIRKLHSPYLTAHAAAVRDRESPAGRIRASLQALGEEVGRQILSACLVESVKLTTPMNEEIETLTFSRSLSIVVTTKADLENFGTAIAVALEPSRLGYMNFAGRRGLEALSSPVREIELPDVRGTPVETVVIAKSCLATGCTAVSLAKTAMQEYLPRQLVIAAVFYSNLGLRELEDNFPHSQIFVVGEPDVLDDNGMLHPGVGLLDDRILG